MVLVKVVRHSSWMKPWVGISMLNQELWHDESASNDDSNNYQAVTLFAVLISNSMGGVQSVTGAWRRVWNLPSWLNVCARGPSVCAPAFLKSPTNIEIDNECDPCRSWQVLRGGLSKSAHPAHPPYEWRQKKKGTIDPVLLFIRMCLIHN